MDTRDVLLQLRTEKGLSQEQLAEKVFVTRQAVSRWETGETTPNTETLKLLSNLYDVSINTLLGSPRTRPPAKSRTAHSTRTTANGATQTAPSNIQARSS